MSKEIKEYGMLRAIKNIDYVHRNGMTLEIDIHTSQTGHERIIKALGDWVAQARIGITITPSEDKNE